MEEKYKKAVIAGIICGIILVILTLANVIVERYVLGNQIEEWTLKYTDPNYAPEMGIPEIPGAAITGAFVTLMLVMLGALTFLGAGALAAKMTSPYINNRNDALAVGAISGAVAEVVHRPFAMLSSFVADLLRPLSYDAMMGSSSLLNALTQMVSQAICCFPVILIAGIMLAVIGAFLYSILKLKV